MEIYNQTKTAIIQNPDFDKGYLVDDYLEIIHPEQPAIAREVAYETVATYPNGGKDIKEIVLQEGREYKAGYTEKKEIKVYIPYTTEQLQTMQLQELRRQRQTQCFSIINRGKLWYDTLSTTQLVELDVWYKQWLDVTKTLQVPANLSWIN